MKYYFFIGTTAEFIKTAPVIKQFQDKNIPFKLIVSGQGKIRFSEFSFFLKKPLQASITLPYKGDQPSLARFVMWAFASLFSGVYLLRKEFSRSQRPILIVHGDTVSSLIGALIAKIYGVQLAHIESGLRSFNFLEPFPEELSRYVISRLADVHFCPNAWSVENLKNVSGKKINTTQNTLLDIYRSANRHLSPPQSLSKLPKRYYVLVLHRQEHVIFQKEHSRQLLNLILSHNPKLDCVLVMHQLASDFMASMDPGISPAILKKIHFVPRLPYLEFMSLVKGAQYIITDGGSNQEEAFYMGVPCLLLRKHTERIEGLGKNVCLSLMETSAINEFMDHYKKYKKYPVLPSARPSRLIASCLQEL